MTLSSSGFWRTLGIERRGRRLAIYAICACLFGASSAFGHPQHVEPEKPVAASAGPTRAAPPPPKSSLYSLPLTWLDESGAEVSLSKWSGSRVLLSMFYTSCYSHICSVAVDLLQDVNRALERDSESLPIVLISLDHAFDKPKRLEHYKRGYKMGEGWHLLVGTEEQTQQFTKRLGYDFWKEQPREIIHPYSIYLLDAEGRVEKVIDYQMSAEDVVDLIVRSGQDARARHQVPAAPKP